MSPSTIDFAELHDLCSAQQAAALSPEAAARLERLVVGSAEACDYYLRYVGFCANLEWSSAPREAFSHQEVDQVASESPAGSPLLSFPGSAIHGAIGYFSQGMPLAYLMATVLLALGLLIASLIPVSPHEQIATTFPQPAPAIGQPKMETVAKITGMVDCRFEKGSGVRGQGSGTANQKSEIRNQKSLVVLGDKFALASGLMEITYVTGAKVILQGPATYEVESNGGYLAVGKLTGKLEKTNDECRMMNDELRTQLSDIHPSSFILHPFVVRTPTATVTDLGTEFGVEVHESGATETHVFRGAVELRVDRADATAPRLLRLAEHQSARVEIGKDRVPTVRRTTASAGAFVRQLPKLKRTRIEVFNTGIGVAEGRPDPHWQIVAVSNQPKFRPRSALVTRTHEAWLPNEPGRVQWISLVGDCSNLPNGVTYTFRTTFELPSGAQPRTAALNGFFSVDNYVRAIRLNGQKAYVPRHTATDYRFSQQFWVSRGFVPGTNVLEFDVENNGEPGENWSASPMGLHVEFEGFVAVEATAPDAGNETPRESRRKEGNL